MLQTCDPEIADVAKYDCKLVISEILDFGDVANLCFRRSANANFGDRGCCKLVFRRSWMLQFL